MPLMENKLMPRLIPSLVLQLILFTFVLITQAKAEDIIGSCLSETKEITNCEEYLSNSNAVNSTKNLDTEIAFCKRAGSYRPKKGCPSEGVKAYCDLTCIPCGFNKRIVTYAEK